MTRDVDIRAALKDEMTRLHGQEPDTRVVEELGLCQGLARVDLAVINGSLHGYEIKSDRDTLDRLPSQAEIYNRSLELVTIVAGPSHLQQIRSLVPYWWGIWSAASEHGKLSLKKDREASRNPNISSFALAQLLWRNEVLEVLEERQLNAGMKSKSRRHLWLRASEALTPAEIADAVRSRLKTRGEAWRGRKVLV